MEDSKRPRPGQVEERQAPDLEVDGKKIRGRIPYGVESREMPGGWREVIERGALNRAKFDDLVVTVDHVGLPLGRYPGTLELEDRDDGLHWSVDPPKSRADIREAIERGDLRGGSWRMVVAKDEWRGDTRHVQEIELLRDVAIVTRPAYESAAVELRSQDNNNAAEERQKENTMADEVRDGGLEAEDRHEKQEEPRSIPAGSLRVEDRTVDADIRFQSLAELVRDRGFALEDRSAAVIGFDEFRSFTWAAGTVLTGVNPIRREGVGLGFDRRWLFPALPTTAVDSATTAVQYIRQTTRTLAGTATIRPLDSVANKPETSTAAELATLQFEQVATVNPGIPRIHAAQPAFASYVESDLRLAVSDGLDEVVRRGVVTAGTAAAVVGDILQKTRRAMTVIEAAGYSPTTLAIDAAGAESLDLLRSAGSEQFYLWGPGQGAPGGPFGLEMRVWKSAGTAVLDANSFGRFYVAPIELRSFEENAGRTNTLTVRAETHAGYAVERVSAGLRIL
jgi:HK97 family phage prohead protease